MARTLGKVRNGSVCNNGTVDAQCIGKLRASARASVGKSESDAAGVLRENVKTLDLIYKRTNFRSTKRQLADYQIRAVGAMRLTRSRDLADSKIVRRFRANALFDWRCPTEYRHGTDLLACTSMRGSYPPEIRC